MIYQCSHCGHNNEIKTRKGASKHPLYITWSGMISRCANEANGSYRYYGGRGIKVCDRWKSDFWSFVSDMGERPEGMTLDRIDNNGNYEPSNCRWASKFVQRANQSNTGQIPGVYYDKRRMRWISCQKENGRIRFWKSFKNRYEAILFNEKMRIV